MNIDSLVQFKLNPNVSGYKIMVVGLEERPYLKFRNRIREIKQNYIDTKGKCSQDLIQGFENDYRISPFDIMLHGSNELHEDMATKIIPRLPNGNYKCFDLIDKTKNTPNKVTTSLLIGHETAVMSWRCFINLIGRPKYVIIYKALKTIHDDIE